MKEKLLCALQVIKSFLWGTYCGMRLCVYLSVVMALLMNLWYVVGLTCGINTYVITDVIIFSMLFAILSQWIVVFMPRTSKVKSGAIAYAVYMLLVAFCLYYDIGDEVVLRRQLIMPINKYYVIFAPVFPIMLTVVERFFADKLQGWWRRIAKWLYNGIVILPLLAVAVFGGWLCYTDYQRKHRFADNEVIERITGVALPEFEIIDYKKGDAGFTGDYNDELTLEIEEELSESTYHYLDSIISAGNTDWSKCNDEYRFSIMWGNGLPAPKGESEEEDIFLSVALKKGEKRVTISFGMW